MMEQGKEWLLGERARVWRRWRALERKRCYREADEEQERLNKINLALIELGAGCEFSHEINIKAQG